MGSVPGSGRSPGEENSNPLQYFCLENPKDSGAWQATVRGVEKSQTQLSLQAGCAEWGLFPPHFLLGDAQPLMHIELCGEFKKFTPMHNPCLIESEALVWGTESTFC